MVSGALYRPDDPELSADRTRARLLLKALNESRDDQPAFIAGILAQLLPAAGKNLVIQPPFFCDYGYNIYLGDQVFFNFNCVVLDVAPVRIGSRSMFGPAVQIYAATHPIDAATRASGVELGKPVTIGEDVWVGGGSIICPGVTIGDGTVIGAGSVVTKDIPAGMIAAGNPCRVLRAV